MGRALLIEHSAQLRASFSEYLSERGIDVYTAHGAADGIAMLTAVKPEVTALALSFRDDDEFELIPSICDSGSLCLVVTEQDDSENRMRALSLGADGYLVKPVEPEELFLRVRNMIAHRQPCAGQEAQNTILDLNGIRVDLMSRALIGPNGESDVELTATELTMLRKLSENIDRIVSKEALFGAMHNEAYSSATRSLDVGVSRLRIKLRKAGAPVDIRSVRQAGYILSRAAAGRAEG